MAAKGRGILRWYVFPVRPCAARLGLGGRGPGLEVADDGLVEPTAEVLDAGEPAVGLQLQTVQDGGDLGRDSAAFAHAQLATGPVQQGQIVVQVQRQKARATMDPIRGGSITMAGRSAAVCPRSVIGLAVRTAGSIRLAGGHFALGRRSDRANRR